MKIRPSKKLVKQVPAMTRAEYEAMPPEARYFIPWADACRPKKIKLPSPARLAAAVDYFTRTQ